MDIMSFVIGVCCGMIVMAIIADHANKAHVGELEERIKEDRLGYQRSIDALAFEVERMKRLLPAKRVSEDLVEEYLNQQAVEEQYREQNEEGEQ